MRYNENICKGNIEEALACREMKQYWRSVWSKLLGG